MRSADPHLGAASRGRSTSRFQRCQKSALRSVGRPCPKRIPTGRPALVLGPRARPGCSPRHSQHLSNADWTGAGSVDAARERVTHSDSQSSTVPTAQSVAYGVGRLNALRQPRFFDAIPSAGCTHAPRPKRNPDACVRHGYPRRRPRQLGRCRAFALAGGRFGRPTPSIGEGRQQPIFKSKSQCAEQSTAESTRQPDARRFFGSGSPGPRSTATAAASRWRVFFQLALAEASASIDADEPIAHLADAADQSQLRDGAPSRFLARAIGRHSLGIWPAFELAAFDLRRTSGKSVGQRFHDRSGSPHARRLCERRRRQWWKQQ